MNVKPFFDSYELRARILPSLIVVSPLVLFAYALLSTSAGGWLSVAGTGGIAVAGVYGASFVVRQLGRRAEGQLWADWSGEPSVRFARWRDSRFGPDLKKQIHQSLASKCGIDLMPVNDELRDPEGADRLIRDGFQRVRGVLRREDRDGLWFKHSCEYGFARNLYGSRRLFAGLGASSGVASAAMWWITGGAIWGVVALANIGLAVVAVIVGWLVLPAVVRECADRYGESSWMSFLSIVDRGSV